MSAAAPREFNCHEQAQPSWVDRAERAARLIAPVAARLARPTRVSDIGCGDMKLHSFLAAEIPGVVYRGFDLVPQRLEVARLDVRTQALPVPTDVAMMLGVTEYLENLAEVLRRLAGEAAWLLVSHVVREYSAYKPEKLRELNWVNHLAAAEFRTLLERSEFRIEAEELTANRRTMLWLCRSTRVAPAPE